MLNSIGEMPMEGGISVDEILNLKRAAEFLNVSERVLLKLLQEEEVPARKIGKEWRFSARSLSEFVGSGNSKDYVRKMETDENLD